MTQNIDFDDDDPATDDRVVGHCYYEPAKMTGNQFGEAIMLCLDCDDGNQAPPNYGKARIRNDGKYGSAVPHLECDDCGKKFTKGDP